MTSNVDTHAGTPIAIAKNARMLHPQPYPTASYIYGAKRGNPNPHNDLKKEAAANADAA